MVEGMEGVVKSFVVNGDVKVFDEDVVLISFV